MPERPLSGRSIVTTRDRLGRLDSELAALGADVIHVPLIRIEPPADTRLDAALRRISEFDWVLSGHNVPWIDSLNARFHLGADGLSVLMIFLTALLSTLSIYYSAGTVRHRGAVIRRDRFRVEMGDWFGLGRAIDGDDVQAGMAIPQTVEQIGKDRPAAGENGCQAGQGIGLCKGVA